MEQMIVSSVFQQLHKRVNVKRLAQESPFIWLISSVSLLLVTSNALAITSGVTDALVHFQQELEPVWGLLVAASRLMGVWFGFMAIYKLKVYGRMTAFMSQNASLLGPLAYLGVSAILWYLPEVLDVSMQTFWTYDYSGIKSYTTLGGTDWNAIVTPLTIIMRIIGLIAFLRGWSMLVKTVNEGSQPGTFSKGIVHIVGGILSMNILGTIETLRTSFGMY